MTPGYISFNYSLIIESEKHMSNSNKALKVEIRKNVPLPPFQRGRYGRRRGLKYPLDKMEIGDSIFIPGLTGSRASGYIRSYSYRRHKWGMPPLKFSIRILTENGLQGCGVWRIA